MEHLSFVLILEMLEVSLKKGINGRNSKKENVSELVEIVNDQDVASKMVYGKLQSKNIRKISIMRYLKKYIYGDCYMKKIAFFCSMDVMRWC